MLGQADAQHRKMLEEEDHWQDYGEEEEAGEPRNMEEDGESSSLE